VSTADRVSDDGAGGGGAREKAVLRVPSSSVAAGPSTLDPAAARYVARVHRLGPGDGLTLFDPSTRLEADATIVRISREAVDVEIGNPRASTALPRRPVTLVQAVGKGDKMDAIVRDATELGATRIAPLAAERSVAERATEKVLARWRRISIEAARQCGRGDCPRVETPRAIDEVLADLDADLRVVLAPGAPRSLGDVHRAGARHGGAAPSVAIAVGPEGGFTSGELQRLAAERFEPVSLGRFILRTETAATAALAIALDIGG
jgi:16S rRNA (uracil1498-N3)-methyltransferase